MFDTRNESSAEVSPSTERKPARQSAGKRRYRNVTVNGRIDKRLHYRPGYGPGDTIHYYGPDPGGSGKAVRMSTGCKDPVAAQLKANQWEQLASDPHRRAAESTTFPVAMNEYLAFMATMEPKGRPGGKVKPETIEKIRKEKFGMLARYIAEELGFENAEMPISLISGDWVMKYIVWRQGQYSGRLDGSKVSNYTIKREVNYLLSMLAEQAFRGNFHTPIDRIRPPKDRFRGACRRVQRFPTADQVERIIDALPSDRRRAHVMFLIATGLRWSESVRARRWHYNEAKKTLFVDGEKTKGSRAEIPITKATEHLLLWALENAPGKGQDALLFAKWSNPSKQIKRVCKRLGLPMFGVHDFRRLFAHLQLDAGASLDYTSKLLRHGTTQLVQTVYGNISQADRLRAKYDHEVVRPAPIALPRVQPVCNADGETGVEGREGRDETQGKAPGSDEGAALLSPVHGRRAGDDSVAENKTSGEPTPSGRVQPVCMASGSAATLPGERAPHEPGLLPPAGGPEGAGTLVAAMEVLLAFVQAHADSAEGKAALARAMQLMQTAAAKEPSP